MKHSFVLLELIIALILCGLCLVPLLEIPIRALQKESHTTTLLALERLSEVAFAEIKVELYRQQIPWKSLSAPQKEKVLLLEKPISIGKHSFIQKAFLYCSSQKEDRERKEKRLITIEIEYTHPRTLFFSKKQKPLSSQSFYYKVFVTTE